MHLNNILNIYYDYIFFLIFNNATLFVLFADFLQSTEIQN